METKTPAKASTKAPAKAPVEGTTPVLPVEEEVIGQVAALEAAAAPKRLTLVGWAWTKNQNYKKGENGAKSRLYFSMKYRNRENADIITEVHTFGAQADFLAENMVHNTQVVARGRFVDKPRKDDPSVIEQIFVLNDAYGLTLPIPKKR